VLKAFPPPRARHLLSDFEDALNGISGEAGLTFLPLADETYQVICPPAHPFAQRDSLGAELLSITTNINRY
jgi:hypothetical protein